MFLRLEPRNLHMCRDNVSDILETRTAFEAERARRVHETRRLDGVEERVLAADWRRRKEVKSRKPRGGSALGGSTIPTCMEHK